jgi:D-amino-acid dehydrogenase
VSLAIEAALAARSLTMRIAVIGAGIVGVTTAYELALDGHEVTVLERRGSVAGETSFANAGLVAPGYVDAVEPRRHAAQRAARAAAAPGPVHLGLRLDRRSRWMWKWWRACGAARSRATASDAAAGAVQPRAPARADDAPRARLRTLRRRAGAAAQRAGAGAAQPGSRCWPKPASSTACSTPRNARGRAGLNPELRLHAGL